MMAKLLALLPTLAVLSVTLTALELAPSALAHRPAVLRSANEHHRHLAAREKVRSNIHKREGEGAKRLVKKGANGSQCRIRGQSSSFSSSTTPTSTSASSSESSSAEPTETSSSAEVVAVQVTVTSSSSTAAAGQGDYAQPTASTTSTSAAAAAASSSSSSSSISVTLGSGGWTNTNSKFGAGWPNGDYASSSDPNYIGNYIGSKTAWYYNWGYSCSSADKLGIEFVPMLWGPSYVSDWWSAMDSWPSTVKNALFFNEPNDSGQSNIAAGDAVQYWMNDFVPLRAKGVRLGGAATTSADTGLEWIQAFSAACTNDGNSAADCTMDFVPLHFYYNDIQNFQNYVSNFHTQTGLNVWITEYACQSYVSGAAQCSEAETWAMHQQMSAWFDEQDYVERYAPFGMMEDLQGVNTYNALMDSGGSITDLGSWYIGSS